MHRVYHSTIVCIIVLILISSFGTSSDILSVAVGGIILLAFFLLNQKVWKRLTFWENLGIAILFISTVTMTVLIFLYFLQPLVQSFEQPITRLLLKLISTIIVLTFAVNTFERIALKITSGKFPSRIEEISVIEDEK